jgi:hypothetical protein
LEEDTVYIQHRSKTRRLILLGGLTVAFSEKRTKHVKSGCEKNGRYLGVLCQVKRKAFYARSSLQNAVEVSKSHTLFKGVN